MSIDTLSLVIIFCDGMFIVMVREVTRVICSNMGMRIMSPGPRTPVSLPRKKITPRSYSLTTRSESATSTMTIGAAMYIQFIPLFYTSLVGAQLHQVPGVFGVEHEARKDLVAVEIEHRRDLLRGLLLARVLDNLGKAPVVDHIRRPLAFFCLVFDCDGPAKRPRFYLVAGKSLVEALVVGLRVFLADAGTLAREKLPPKARGVCRLEPQELAAESMLLNERAQ